ncbi:hypothetical protein AUJ83_02200 [Candidatus Woesearchaeota archaeon CG1_02_33_12]|nr:MAG: hypothetical protein AUJ83_02200 [Candidatus Woesearchaeota archaeon CG1_02_33_12]PIN78846.1 MAG: hypothetical protein COV14_01850 [Candidatus Woesearchaeota archaeon CG10_big_fil_rev_8_21_14_0_10_33_12]PIU72080.1 MAG: hypothetical protein COS79_04760 [Candidatus Woesearchaeota archaeon CG06_land_8_20_14_3_00_33_13]
MDKLRGKKLNSEVYKIIKKSWPIHPSEVCRKLNIEPNVSNISKIKYHFDILRKNKKIRTTKIDRALVGWPVEIERLRILHEFIEGMD